MTSSHFVMQGKGGVGKSVVAALLFQYFQKRGFEVFGCDTDPVNSSFASYNNIEAKILDIMDGDDIAPGRFDELIDYIFTLPEDSRLVVDIGASCFVALCSYLKKNEALDYLRQNGHEVTIHTVITGGAGLLETLNNLLALARHFYDVPLVVWLNTFFGEISLDGETFEHFKVYRQVAPSVKAIIEMPKLSELFQRSFSEMLARHGTFEESLINPATTFMGRHRLRKIWQDFQDLMDQARLAPEPSAALPLFSDQETPLSQDGLS
jgi:hypothetical protein